MKEIYFTLTATNHYYGSEFFTPGTRLTLKKEPDNQQDHEAIEVLLPGLGRIGYVANSPYTVVGESYSAGRLYDKIDDTAEGEILYVLPKGALCRVSFLPKKPAPKFRVTPRFRTPTFKKGAEAY